MEKREPRSKITLFVNGQEHSVTGENAFLPLAQYLRYKAQLPGTKIVCSEGDCGACTVIVAPWAEKNWSEFKIINSCIAPVYLFDLAAIVSVEGLEMNENLNQVQEKMREFHGGQCGYCTPGIVCSLSGLAEKTHTQAQSLDEKKARNYLTGNLCRCTGYESILNAAKNVDLSKWQSLKSRYETESLRKKAELLFQDDIVLSSTQKLAFLPKSLNQAIELKNRYPEARIVAGATDLGVIHNKGRIFLDQIVSLYRVVDLPSWTEDDKQIFVPATMSLSQFEEVCETRHPELNRLLRVFASPQIKNQGTLLGNVINGSPIGDTIPALLILNAEIQLGGKKGVRKVQLKDFYKSYKVMDITPDEIALGIIIPRLSKEWTTKYYKVSVRKDLDISAVTFAGAIKLNGSQIEEVRFALGGVGPTVVRLPTLEKELCGKDFSETTLREAGLSAQKLVTPISDLRASKEYRNKLVENLFQKFFHDLKAETLVCL